MMLLAVVLHAQTGYAQSSDAIAARRAELEAQLSKLESLIATQQTLLQEKQGKRTSLERDLDIIDAEIRKAKLAIQAQELVIRNLEQDIVSKEATIQELTDKIDRTRVIGWSCATNCRARRPLARGNSVLGKIVLRIL